MPDIERLADELRAYLAEWRQGLQTLVKKPTRYQELLITQMLAQVRGMWFKSRMSDMPYKLQEAVWTRVRGTY